jgi:LmbE family N-acetylglucosaminyl deacetylase
MTRQPPNESLSRRQLLTGLAGGAATLGLPLAGAAEKGAPPRKLKVIVAGGHPDDPESCAGGTIARYSDDGHDVICLYLTRGEAGKRAPTPEETAIKRIGEAKKSCEILRARPMFAGQVDGTTEVTNAAYEAFTKIIEAEKPDIVFTHWPVDYHRDHRATSMLVLDAWFKSPHKFELFYFEGHGGAHRLLFQPTHYVDITKTEARKQEACLVHGSGPRIYKKYHDLMNRFRGLECGCEYAEAFIHQYRGPGALLT